MIEFPVLTNTSDVGSWLQTAQTSGGVALIDKQELWTSFDCVAKLRGATRIKRVGHAGTLDPLATGLLLVSFGKATKIIPVLQEAGKVYEVVIKLGATTATDDRGSEEVVTENVQPVPADVIESALHVFVGDIQQTAPAFSAIRHQGKRQYDLAREGKPFVEKIRSVTVHSITDIKIAWPYVHCTVACSKGTYIRSIGRDLGKNLGVGGYVHALRRTFIGAYTVQDALTITDMVSAVKGLVTV